MGSNQNGDDFSGLVLDLGSAVKAPLLVTGSEEVEREARRLGVGVVLSAHVDKGKAYLVDGKHEFGSFPVRMELSVLTADLQPDAAIGWKMYENVAVGAYNPRGVSALGLDRGLVLLEWPIPDLEPVWLRSKWSGGETVITVFLREEGAPAPYRGEVGRVSDSGQPDPLTLASDVRNFLVSKVVGRPPVPSDPFWKAFVDETVRLHVAASVMES